MSIDNNNSRVYISEIGMYSCLGDNLSEAVLKLRNGYSGLVFSDIQGYPTALGRIKFNEEYENTQYKDRGLKLSLNVVSQTNAARDIDPNRVAVFWGVGLAGAHCIEKSFTQYINSKGRACLSPWTVADIMPNAVASHISKTFGIKGGCWTLSNACASSAMAIGQAYHAIRQGHIDAAIVGGSDSMLIPTILYAWSRMRVLTRTTPDLAHQSCRPLDRKRKGLALAEGAACLILKSERLNPNLMANSLAEISGFGHSCDASGMTSPQSQGQLNAMRIALLDSSLRVEQLDYVCAHATGTLAGDPVEMQALKSLWNEKVPHCPVSSLKSAMGHSMAACGAMQAAVCVSMLREQWIAPTLHLDVADDVWSDWTLPSSKGIDNFPVNHILSNSFGFGGLNASLIFSKINQKPVLL